MALLLLSIVLVGCVLGFYRTSSAQPRNTGKAFAPAAAQRDQQIQLLKEIKSLLEQQNELLRGGQK